MRKAGWQGVLAWPSILWRPALPAGMTFEGPAVVEEPNSTILIHPGDKVTVTPTGHLVIDLHFA